MKLTDYMKQNNLTQKALGELLDVSQGAIAQWGLEGRRVPAEHCAAIERITQGAVTCGELRPDVFLDSKNSSCKNDNQPLSK